MQIRFTRAPLEQHWVVTVEVVALSSREQEQLTAFGGFLLAIGGEFTGAETYTLAARTILVPSELPVKQLFSIVDLTNDTAKAQAEVWEDTLRVRIQDALDTWMADDPIAGSSVTVTTFLPTPA